MKNNIIIIVFSLISTFAFSQVGINTDNPHASASLHVQSSNKGFLAPRVALSHNTDQVTVLNPAKGLVVYNTNTSTAGSNQVTKDNYYFWDGVKWDKIVNETRFLEVLSALKIPKLAGYVYKGWQVVTNSPTGDMVAAFETRNDPNDSRNVAATYDFNNNLYMQYDTTDTSETRFKINQTGVYGFEGFACILMTTYGAIPSSVDTVHPEVVIQKSTDNGASWVDTRLISTSEYDRDLTQNLTIPINFTGVINLNSGDLIRLATRVRFHTTANYQ